jgi:homoserine kinase
MQNVCVKVRVPATTANLGPGFDCLGLALDLWNEVEAEVSGSGVAVEICGEGEARLPHDQNNLLARAALHFYKAYHLPAPKGLKIRCQNQIPLGSGMGSSAAATLSGLMAANALAGSPASREDILRLATEIEGHPDNAAAALWGGLVVVITQNGKPLIYRYDLPDIQVVIVLPQINLPTKVARAALPKQVKISDAVFNIGRSVLVVDALRSGNLALLGEVMEDKLHQPYRLKLIPGSEAAMQAALSRGAAVAISGAGPSLIAYTQGQAEAVASEMVAAFEQVGVAARPFILTTTQLGAQIVP